MGGMNQRIVVVQDGMSSNSGNSRSFNQLMFGYDSNDEISDQEDDDILMPFRNAVVYSRTDNNDRHSKNVFEFAVILLCLIPFTIFLTTSTSIYLFIDNVVGDVTEKTLINYLQPRLISFNIIITTLEFFKFIIALVVAVAFAFVMKVSLF